VLTKAIERVAYANDAGCYRLIPQAIVKPRSVREVQAVMRWSNQTGIPLTFRAAATSLSGQAVGEGVIVDISRGWEGIEIIGNADTVRVQCGIIGARVNEYLRPHRRKLGPDPASMNAALVGGIVANNASGMCCGVLQNSYHTLESMRFVLPNGLLIDSAEPEANALLEREARHIAEGIVALKREIEANTALVEKIRRKYRIKNTIGYALNAFLDFSTPVEILRHLMVGSEGTLGFIADVTFRTVPDHPLKYTGLLFFRTVPEACASIAALRDSGAAALELMDYACLSAMQDQYGAPKDIIQSLPNTACALLVEYQSSEREEFEHLQARATALISELDVLAVLPFTEDYKHQAKLWKLRKGILPVVSAARRPGTTVITEDIAFPIEHLAPAIAGLQDLFVKHQYPDGVIFGHAKDGNVHFNVAQSFNTDADVKQFEDFLHDIAVLVVDKYDGSLKAEHGTGRNMAPFVEKEWGAEAYSIMRRLKTLLDPQNVLNPGVIINDDPQVHLKNLKPIPVVEEEVNNCIECGWCEPRCPSQGLTLTPRQRIVVRREITRLQNSPNVAEAALHKELVEQYNYHGLETCATDGLCATVCPVGINTGDLVKLLREEQHSPNAQKAAVTVAKHFGKAEVAVKAGVWLASAASELGAAPIIRAATKVASVLVGERLPLWNENLGTPAALLHTRRMNADAVYFPACVSRMMGKTAGGELDSKSLASLQSLKALPEHASTPENVIEALVTIADRAGVSLWIPEDCTGLCCGTPFSSKGYADAHSSMLERTVNALWEWSDGGRLPIVTEASSCSYMLRTCGEDLRSEARRKYDQLTILDSIEFTHDVLLPKLRAAGKLTQLAQSVVLHPVCSIVKLGIDGKFHDVAKACAKEAVVPINAGCCAFAGDRGMIAPELTRNATELEAREVCSRRYDGYYSSNPMCEAGMTSAVDEQYTSYLFLVEQATRTNHVVEALSS